MAHELAQIPLGHLHPHRLAVSHSQGKGLCIAADGTVEPLIDEELQPIDGVVLLPVILDEIEEDLDAIEDFIMDEDDEDYDDDDVYDFSDDDEDDYEDEGFDFGDEDSTIYEVECACGEIIDFDEETLEAGSIVCPNCGETLEFSLDDEDDE